MKKDKADQLRAGATWPRSAFPQSVSADKMTDTGVNQHIGGKMVTTRDA